MNVLSLFDGISCGRVALDRAGIEVDNYYASEIDRHAIKVSEDNFKDIVRLGDVTQVKYIEGKLHYAEGVLDVGKIDLLIGGSPCQSFSPAAAISGNREGLDGKSKLFYEFLRILKEIQEHNLDVLFLLENVRMRKGDKASLDAYLGVEGMYFNSDLVSFQKRPRVYWTNWEWQLPEDKSISFQDFKEKGDLTKYKVNPTKSRLKMWSGGVGSGSELGICANVTYADKIYCLTTKQDRCPNSGLVEYEDFCRYLTRAELEQAQTLPIGYTKAVTYNQAQVVLGNCWTVDAVAHIFKTLKE